MERWVLSQRLSVTPQNRVLSLDVFEVLHMQIIEVKVS